MLRRKVHRIHKAGNLEDLKLTEEEISFPKENEVCIKVHSIGLNFADIFALTGLYSATPKGSFIPGLEFSGTILEKGKGVKKFKLGDKVMGVTRFGGYANYINIDSHYIKKLPKDWSFEQGAAFVVQALTAYYALITLGNLQEGQTVLIHSAAGGVGILANRIAKKYNAFTIGTVGSTNKLSVLEEENYDLGIVRDENFAQRLKDSLKQRELNLVLECVGGKIFEESYKALARGGRLVSYGAAEFTPTGNTVDFFKVGLQYLFRPKIDPLELVTANKSVMGFNLIWMYDKYEELSQLFEKIMRLNLPPQRIGKIFPFEKAKEAIYYFQSGKTIGKILLNV